MIARVIDYIAVICIFTSMASMESIYEQRLWIAVLPLLASMIWIAYRSRQWKEN